VDWVRHHLVRASGGGFRILRIRRLSRRLQDCRAVCVGDFARHRALDGPKSPRVSARQIAFPRTAQVTAERCDVTTLGVVLSRYFRSAHVRHSDTRSSSYSLELSKIDGQRRLNIRRHGVPPVSFKLATTEVSGTSVLFGVWVPWVPPASELRRARPALGSLLDSSSKDRANRPPLSRPSVPAPVPLDCAFFRANLFAGKRAIELVDSGAIVG
jgi:hypothetical protein